MEPGLPPFPPDPEPAAPLEPFHWPSAWQLGISAIALLGLWGLSALFIFLGLVDQFSPPATVDGTQMFLIAAGLGFFGFLILPSIGFSLGRLLNRPVHLPGWLRLDRLWRIIFLFPLVLLLGHLVATRTGLSWIFLPPLHIIALGLPILFIFWIGARGINNGNIQRLWGVFGAGLVLGPTIILLVEFFALMVVVLLGAVVIASQPDRLAELYNLAEQLQSLEQNPIIALELIEPYLYRPEVVLTIFLFAAGLVPIIEELFKPIGVWFLGREATPAQGFLAGLISGGGYALFENLALSSQSAEWALAVSARAGTSLLHMVTAGLVGWATVYAWRTRKYSRVVGAYLAAVLIHGLWNGMTLLTLVNILDAPAASYLAVLQPLGAIAPVVLGVLAIGSLVLLITLNRTHRDTKNPGPDGPPTPDTQTEEPASQLQTP